MGNLRTLLLFSIINGVNSKKLIKSLIYQVNVAMKLTTFLSIQICRNKKPSRKRKKPFYIAFSIYKANTHVPEME